MQTEFSDDFFAGILRVRYCQCENFIFANNERNICNVKNWRPGHDLSSSVNGRVIS